MEVEIEIDPDVFLPCYQHLSDDKKIDIEFLYGGRDSGKSRDTAMRLVQSCLSDDYFKCILIRKVGDTILESQWADIKLVTEEWGIDHLFTFIQKPLGIKCANGNRFIGKGLDDATKVKSMSNPTHAWIEEGNQIENDDLVIILTSLRANNADVKTYFTFNPECDGNYTDFWLWMEWFSHTDKLSWEWTKAIEVGVDAYNKFPDVVYEKDGKYYMDQHVRATHTTYHDNPYCSPLRIAMYESYKNSKTNSYWYQTYTLGLWGFRKSGGNFCKSFEESRDVADLTIIDSTYHIVVDNNVSPYISIQIWQINLSEKTLMTVDELPCSHPDNSAKKAAHRTGRWLKDKYYTGRVYIYGDPSANARSTNDDAGLSFFDKFKAELEEMGFRLEDRVQRSAPRVAASGDFLNDIWEKNFAGWTIITDTKCRKTIEDFQMTKEASDGTILKKRITDKETGISYEKYGHWVDNTRYFITTVLPDEYRDHQHREEQYLTRSN